MVRSQDRVAILFEMPRGKPVLALEEEGAGEFRADPDRLGPADRHLAEGDDSRVQQRVPGLLRKTGLFRCHHCRVPPAEQRTLFRGIRGRGSGDRHRGTG